jgi:hypothetical protein
LVPETKTIKNRLHLDIYPSGGRGVPLEQRIPLVDARVAELVAAGATVQRRYPDDFDSPDADGYFVVMSDPEGNEFCVA